MMVVAGAVDEELNRLRSRAIGNAKLTVNMGVADARNVQWNKMGSARAQRKVLEERNASPTRRPGGCRGPRDDGPCRGEQEKTSHGLISHLFKKKHTTSFLRSKVFEK
jgi:hypothetical protein